LRVVGGDHDNLPKLGLGLDYIGDGIQLCADMPSHSFLRSGATYKNVGVKVPDDGSIPGDLDPSKSSYSHGPNVHPQYNAQNPFTSQYKRFVPVPSSPLYQLLCGSTSSTGIPTPTQPCTFPAEVTLTKDLVCHGRECRLDKDLVYVQIIDATTQEAVFFEFDKPLCVQMAFYESPKLMALNHPGSSKMCANPKVADGGAVCCMDPSVGAYYG